MIVWGWGGDVLKVGVLGTRRCETCEKDRPFNAMLRYRYWGLYWVFNFVTKKQYVLACDVCGRGWEVEASKIERHFKSVPIPFTRRYGFLTLIGIIFGL